MDDFILFTHTSWYLRKTIKRLHEFSDLVGLETHADDAQLGGLIKALTGWGYVSHRRASRATENHRECIARLYEQARLRELSMAETDMHVREYGPGG